VITAVDTNILIDILEPDPVHGLRSKEALKKCLHEGAVVACAVVWSEVAAAYGETQDDLTDALRAMRIGFSALNYEAALSAARSWHGYRQRGGGRERSASDFLIGGHASAQAERLLTRDFSFFRKYFAGLAIVSP